MIIKKQRSSDELVWKLVEMILHRCHSTAFLTLRWRTVLSRKLHFALEIASISCYKNSSRFTRMS